MRGAKATPVTPTGCPNVGLLSFNCHDVKFSRLNRLNTSSVGSMDVRALNLMERYNRRSTRCRSFLLKLFRGITERSARSLFATVQLQPVTSMPDVVVR